MDSAKISISAEQVREMLEILLRNPTELLLSDSCRQFLARDRWIKNNKYIQIHETTDQGVMPGTIAHNRGELDEDGFKSVRRSRRLIDALSAIEPVYSSAAQLKVLSIGPRTEMELLYLIAMGFRQQNIASIDLISSSPLIDLGDMHDLPYADQSFDVVLAGWVIAYSKQPERAVAEMVRVAKHGALIALGITFDPGFGSPDNDPENISGSMQRSSEDMIKMLGPRLWQVCFRHDPVDEQSKWPVMLIARVRR